MSFATRWANVKCGSSLTLPSAPLLSQPPHGLVADIDPALKQQVFDFPKGEWIADIGQHRGSDHLRCAVEITAGIVHRRRLSSSPAPLKPIYLNAAGWYISLESKYVQFLASLRSIIYGIGYYYEKRTKNNIEQKTYKFDH